MKINLLQFCFQGGNRSEHDVQGSFPDAGSWATLVKEMAVTSFPTYPQDDSSVQSMAFANLPGGDLGKGVRIHCVYFEITRARAFRNVFCFAYRIEECPIEKLAAISSEEWYRLCCQLTSADKQIELPEKEFPRSGVPRLTDKESGILLYNFPDRRGKIRTGELSESEWQKIIQPPPKQQPPVNERTEEHFPWRQVDIRYAVVMACAAFLLGGFLGGLFVWRTMIQRSNDVPVENTKIKNKCSDCGCEKHSSPQNPTPKDQPLSPSPSNDSENVEDQDNRERDSEEENTSRNSETTEHSSDLTEEQVRYSSTLRDL